MTIDLSATAADAWALWRRDRAVLWPLAGLFLFVPTLALLLFVEPLVVGTGTGAQADPAQTAALIARYRGWIAANSGYFLTASFVSAFGTLAILGLYLDRAAATVGDALTGAMALLPRYILASLVTTVATMIGFAMFFLPGIYLAGRWLLIAPVLVAEAPISAIDSVARALRITQRHGWLLAGVIVIAFIADMVLPAPFQSLDTMLRNLRAANPLVIILVDGAAAAIATAVALGLLLFKVALYRRLA
ncbi:MULTISPECIES: hypothetical protein [Sphingomonas]|uniref:hypothetical protein n=1 Tax=Sphingomonas TaxID=13687 RepID=UPI00083379E2|nr:hypothetical protein [Sphingomonas sp. CCH10-B3]